MSRPINFTSSHIIPLGMLHSLQTLKVVTATVISVSLATIALLTTHGTSMTSIASVIIIMLAIIVATKGTGTPRSRGGWVMEIRPLTIFYKFLKGSDALSSPKWLEETRSAKKRRLQIFTKLLKEAKFNV